MGRVSPAPRWRPERTVITVVTRGHLFWFQLKRSADTGRQGAGVGDDVGFAFRRGGAATAMMAVLAGCVWTDAAVGVPAVVDGVPPPGSAAPG